MPECICTDRDIGENTPRPEQQYQEDNKESEDKRVLDRTYVLELQHNAKTEPHALQIGGRNTRARYSKSSFAIKLDIKLETIDKVPNLHRSSRRVNAVYNTS